MINALYRFFSVPYTTNVQIAPLLYLLVPVKKAVVEPENKGEFCKLHTRETPENVKTDDKCISKYKYRLNDRKRVRLFKSRAYAFDYHINLVP